MKGKILVIAVVLSVLLSGNIFIGSNKAKADEVSLTVNAECVADEKVYDSFDYCGAEIFEDRTETIIYTRKEIAADYSIQYDLPNYTGKLGETGCANIAGAVLIGYYDRFNENLIPDYKVYKKLGASFSYKAPNEIIIAVMAELHDLMLTDVGKKGTTFPDFQTGMNKYVSQKGYTYVSNDVLSRGSFNIDNFKQSVQSGKPVALFLSGFAFLSSIEEVNGVDFIHSEYCAATHISVACGYKIYNYYNSNNQLIATRTYLKVASGLAGYDITYLNINNLGNIDNAISVEIK